MKKLLIALLAAVLTSGAFAQDTAFPDIPANHWAADAVARITDLGIIIGFPDGTFRGNEAFTRYQTALVISRTLDVINNNVEAMGAMSAEDIAALNAALEQLASDLAAQGVRLAAAESDVASLGDDVIADGARIDDLEAAINGVMMNMVDPMVVQEMQDQIASLGVAAANAAAASAAADSGLQDQINALEVAIDAADAAASAAASAAAAAASQSAAADAELRQALAALSAAADAASAASAAADSGLQDQIDALGAAAAAAAAASDAADAALSDAIAAASAAAADGDAELRRALAALSAAADAAAAASAAADAALSDAIAAAAAASAAALADAAAASAAADAALSDAIAAASAAAADGDAELRRALAALSAASDDADAGLQDQIDALGAAAAAAAAASDAADAALSDAIAAAAADAAAALADAAAASDAGDAELRRALAALSAASDDADAGLQDQIDALGAAAAAAAAASDAGDAALSDAIAALGAAADDAAAASAAADAELQGQLDVLRVSVEAASARADAASARADAVAAAAAAARAALQGQIDALGAAATVAAAASEAADAELSDAIAAAAAAAAAADAAAAAASEAADAELGDAIDAAAAAAAAADAAAAAAAAAADAGLQDQIDALAAAAAAAAAASEAADAALSDAVDAAAAESAAADAALSDALDALSAAAAAAAAESAAADAALSDAVDAAAAASEAADAALSDAVDAAAAAAAAADAAIRDEVAAAAAELQDQVHALGHDVEDAAAASEAADAALSDALAAAAAESAAADAGLGDSIAAAAAAAEVARAKLSDALAAASAAAAADAATNAAAAADNAGDIANVREFVILLRRNQVAIRDRVAALETADTEQDTAIEGLGNRIGVLESNLFDLSGSIDVSYKMVHATGGDAHFDIDRAFGDGFYRSHLSAISTGTQDDDDDGEVDRQANEDADIQGDKDGDVEVTLNVNLDFGNSLEGFAKLSLEKTPIAVAKEAADGPQLPTDPTTGDGYSLETGEYYVIKVERVYTAATLGGMTDLEIVFGEDAGLSHGAYGSSFTGSDGINFRLVPGMIAFSPEISGFYVPNAEDGDGNTEAAAVQGLELRLSPMEGVSVGGHLSRWADGDTTTRDPVNALVVGFDAEVSLQIFDVAVEWNSASFSDDTSRNDDAFYVTLTVDDGDDMMMPIPLLSSLSASYFDVAEGWADLAQADADSFPFKEDQAGLVANVGLDLVLVDLDGYVTSYRANSTPQDAVLALGATATAPLFSGLSLEGSFRTASVTPQGGTAATVDDVDGRMDANESVVGGAGAASLERDKNYDTGFGITLKHDGMSADALISGLGLELGYSQTEADFSKRTINAGANMTLPLDIITVTPYGSIEWVTDADADADEAEGNATTIKVGAGVTTQPIDTFLAPSLEGNVNYRNTSHVNTVSGNYTANELQFAVGLSLNEFLFDESVLKARYASYSGTNVKPNSLTADPDDPATATYEVGTDANNGLTTATNGFELIWTYHGLELIYGSFTVDPNTNLTGDQSSANYFEIAYSVDF